MAGRITVFVYGLVAYVAFFAALLYLIGFLGNLVVPTAWLLPSLILVWKRDWFVDRWLCQKWLIGLQLWRAIGGLFLIEMARGNIPAIFAYPAGLGDLAVAFIALVVLVKHWNTKPFPGWAVYLVIAAGVLDFASAFLFGFGSSETPLQLFFPEIPNQVILFPTGLIPLFLVPYAIFFHTLSWLSYRRFRR